MKHGVPLRVSPPERLFLELDGRGQRLRGVPLRVHLAEDVAEDLVGQPLAVGPMFEAGGADDICQRVLPKNETKFYS